VNVGRGRAGVGHRGIQTIESWEDILPTRRLTAILTALAAIGCVGTWVSDDLLLGTPISGAEYYRVYPTTMAQVSFERLLWGNTLGLVTLSLELCGLWLLHQVLRRSDERLSWIVLLTLGFSIIAGIAFHVASAFLGTGYQVHEQLDSEVTRQMVHQFETYRETLFRFAQIAVGLGAVFFAAHILLRPTPFPKWMAIINPLTLIVLVRFVAALIPAPLGGYIAPGYFNIAMLLFFVANFIVIWGSSTGPVTSAR
jgi:hypothetical protein